MQDTVAGANPGNSWIDAREERAQRLARYARGRVSHFINRQAMTAAGSMMLALAHGPWIGLLAAALALTGEAVDCVFLRRIERRLAEGADVDKMVIQATVSSGFQALTIAACVVIGWLWAGPTGPLFAVAFLAGAATNAGLTLPYSRETAQARLAIFAITAIGLVSYDASRMATQGVDFYLNLTGIAILGYLVFAFLDFVVKGDRRHRRNLAEINKRQHQLEATNRQLVEQKKEAQRLSLVARSANDSIFLSDRNGRITWVNDAFTRITGYTPEKAIGQRAGDLLNGPRTDQEKITQMIENLRKGKPYRGEIRNVTREGRDIWIETNQVPVLDAGGQVETVVAIERDITDAKRHARDLARAKEHAEMGARAKAEFLANMSHEIRTPMNGIIGMADLICETPLNKDQRLYSETIRASAQGLLTIINDILDLSKLDAEKLVLHPVDFDFRAFLDELMLLFRTQANEKDIDLRLELDRAVPLHIHADETRLRQLLINLIGNALKFTETGSVVVTVASREDKRGTLLDISVQDSGIGIAPEDLEDIFQRFSQAETSNTRRFGGTGLGLTITRMLTELMGGKIGVTSRLGEGTCFSLSVPVGAPHRPAPSQPEAEVDPLRLETLRGKRLLVAEDNRVNRLLVQKYLTGLPLELSFAHDGREAVDKTRSETPDLILMDMSMPQMNGIEAAREIRGSNGITQPIIVALTANAFASDRTACLEAGMDGFLTKPIRRSELLNELMRYCGTPPAGTH